MYEAFLFDLIGGLAQAIKEAASGDYAAAQGTANSVLLEATEAAEGIRVRLATNPWSRVMPCMECSGSGAWEDAGDGKCPHCHGTGQWPLPVR